MRFRWIFMRRGSLRLGAISCLSLALSILTIFTSIQPGLAYNPNDPIRDEVIYKPNDEVLLTMSNSQARQIIESYENRRLPIPPGFTSYTYNDTLFTNIEISPDKISWNEKYPTLYWASTAYFKSMSPRVQKSHSCGTFDVLLCEDAPLYQGCVEQVEHGSQNSTLATVYFWESLNKDEAVSLANAFYVLKRYSEGYKPEDAVASIADFQAKAKAWRALAVKPALSEDVEKCRVMAEDALRNKNFEKAVQYYEKGLAIEPLWPQGQFNAA
ncbi:MAG: hypothetical protein M0017_06510, partial [Desulfobacteraceae bacterium]|nr:hypothetical protein [Desulfobacteraceae bacterium]